VARGRYAAKGVALVSGPRCGLTLTADGERLGQVLANLLDNALRHTPPGGTVTLHGEAVGDRARLVVADDGEGIPAEQLPHVFERFYRGDTSRDRARSGSGIGLTISRAIADAHGGTLEAASDGPGAGATFSLTLPRA
jgi:signal transduction histidine kinase